MEASFNFESLFSKVDKTSYIEKDIFRKAALLFEFSIPDDFKEFEENDNQQLISMANQRSSGKYILEDNLRNEIIRESIGLSNVVESISRFSIINEYAEMLKLALSNAKIDISALPDSSVFYLLKIADLLPNRFSKTDLATELRRRYFFVQFEKMTKNFAGRSKEISRINEYIDWLPKEGVINQISSFFRNTINWHQKKPMLIHGIGGIGKSTLIAKVILDNNSRKNEKKLPFIYIDFDLPGITISEPITILIESLRQLSFQFPKHQEMFQTVSENLSSLIQSKKEPQKKAKVSSNKSQRVFLYKTMDDVIKEYDSKLDNLKKPILVVFDSFEEMQYRATSEELFNFFNFIQEISERIPRIRPVFVGRSEINYTVDNVSFENVQLSEFDKDSSAQMLFEYEVKDKVAAEKIYQAFGGNPLILMLAARVYHDDPASINDFEKQKGTKQEYLVGRILNHIHDPSLRKIAIPGLLVRCITPEIISEVLAGPCKIEIKDKEHALRLFKELEKEAALISRTENNNSIVFRQDLRMACEKMLLEQYQEESKQIVQNAIKYYKDRRQQGPQFEAEYYFHLLKSNVIPEDLTHEKYNSLRNKLESALVELPNRALTYVQSLIGSSVNQEILQSSETYEWEKYFISQIQRGLNSDPEFLIKTENENHKRDDQPYELNQEYAYFKALMYQRLNDFDKSNEIIERTISFLNSQHISKPFYFELLLLQALNLEYQSKFKEALIICSKTIPTNTNNESGISEELKDPELFRKFYMLHVRLSNRMGITLQLNTRILDAPVEPKHKGYTDVYWDYMMEKRNLPHFCNQSELEKHKGNFTSKIKDVNQLEALVRKNLGVYIKDIALTGGFQILLTDCIHAFELEGKLESLDFNLKFNAK